MCPERYFEKEQSGDKVSLIDKDENNIRTESLTKVKEICHADQLW